MKRGKSEIRLATWPGLKNQDGSAVPVALRVLSCSEVQECQADAFRRFQALALDPASPLNILLFEDEVLTQILARACRSVERPHDEAFSLDADDLRENTTVDERAAMFQIYRDFASEIDPAPEDLSPVELDEILSLVKKKDARTLLGLGARRLVSFMLSTAAQPST